MKSSDLTQAELKRLLHYCPETGVFTWLVGRGPVRAGAVAGKQHKSGYRIIKLRGSYFYAHRLAWLYMTGSWPVHDVDHKNRIRTDNWFRNLRDAPRALNCLNTGARGRSGAKGVSWVKAKRRWRVRVRVNGRPWDIGLFECFELAETVAREARDTHHGAFACH